MQFLLKFEMIGRYALNIIKQNSFGILRQTHQYSHLINATYFDQICEFLSVNLFYGFEIKNTYLQLTFIILKILVNQNILANH